MHQYQKKNFNSVNYTDSYVHMLCMVFGEVIYSVWERDIGPLKVREQDENNGS